ncbi:Cytochrome c-type biogenesis protein DsbD, protein-disulfide reductase [hydrothermal vent metagenome]|uniref:Cytochrome c-type biogenesis protein DsbD, protein-disulfide reductase n=1 Tax=hydrothermal vent metagenome TaxID=652676 RepID=A0A3B0ZZK1_9ZZZZ
MFKKQSLILLFLSALFLSSGFKPALAVGDGISALNSLSTSLGIGEDENEILEPDVAFQFGYKFKNNTVATHWEIAPDHYMYRDKFKLVIKEGAGVTIGNVIYPKGDIKDDEFFGKIEVYHNKLDIQIPLNNTTDKTVLTKLKITYQGCAEKIGICYPPIHKTIEIEVAPGAALITAAAATESSSAGFVSEQDQYEQLLGSGAIWKIIIGFFLGGLALAFTACMYPMIPILSSIIVGQGEKVTTRGAFVMSLVYVESMALTFGAMGLIVSMISGSFNIQAYFQSPIVLIPFTLVFIALALSMFGFFTLQLPASLQGKLSQISNQQKGGHLIGVAIMGVLSALIIGPCAGPIIIGALALAAKEGDLLLGFLSMFVLGNGLGLPLLIIGTTGGKFLPKAGSWMDIVKYVAGVILLAIAILMLERVSFIPTMVVMMLWAALFIISGVYLGALEPIKEGGSGWKKLWKGLGVFAIVYGLVVMLGGLTGARNVQDPFHGSAFISGGSSGEPQLKHLAFKPIKSVSDLNAALAQAKAAGKYVMLDYYADWCTYCKTYEDYVFSDPKVQAVLNKNFIVIQADVTDNDDIDQKLLAHTGVQAPPAILFYGKNDSKEKRRFRVVGVMNAEQFLERLQLVLK